MNKSTQPCTVFNLVQLREIDFKSLESLLIQYGQEMSGCKEKVVSDRFVKSLLTDKNIIVTGARVNDELVGFSICFILPEAVHQRTCGQLDDLYILPFYRGKGFARALLEHTIKTGKDLSWSHVRWLVPENNIAAIALYNKIATRAPWLSYVVRIDPSASM